MEYLFFAFLLSAVMLYSWLRFGPKRCPQCRTLTWGYWGTPIGSRRMHFHCRRCGAYFEGNRRLPL